MRIVGNREKSSEEMGPADEATSASIKAYGPVNRRRERGEDRRKGQR